jgi:alanine racemase
MARVAEDAASRQHHVNVEISAERFARNVAFMREYSAPAKLCVVVKADAYGHGLASLAPVAAEAGADYIGVCTNVEAATVRRSLPDMPLLRLRCALRDELDESVEELELEEQVGSIEVAEYLHSKGEARGRRVPVHIKVDTGMGRSGFFPNEVGAAAEVCRMTGIEVVGVITSGRFDRIAEESVDRGSHGRRRLGPWVP